MGEFADIFDAVEDSTPSTSQKIPKKNKPKKPKKEKKKKSKITENGIPNMLDELVTSESEKSEPDLSQMEEQIDIPQTSAEPTKKKEKKKWFNQKHKKDEPEQSSESTYQSKDTWTVMSEDQLTENEAPEEVEDVVDTHERVIGRRIKTELNINEASGLDLTLKDRIELTRKYLNKDQEEARKLDEYRAEEEKRANHVITLRNYVLTELCIHLSDTNQELVMNIDAKFGPYIEEAMREVELGYFIKEVPRNADLVNLNPDLPYKYSFMIRAI